MDSKVFMEALDEIEAQKGISKQSIVDALKEAIKKAYIREIDAEDEAKVDVTINEKEISMTITKTVIDDSLKENIIDYAEIALSDAKKIKKSANVGDEITIDVDVEKLKRITTNVVKSILRQKLSEAEKEILYEQNKDKVNEMISGVVDRCDERGAMVNIGRSSIYLTRKDLIGDEMFDHGDTIRMFVASVSNSGDRGPSVKVSRSDPGFLKRLFEEEVPDIYNGTIIIKAIARDAGIRAKLAVYSNDPNVDCVGACIGVNGTAIKRIVEQLGNRIKDKEKIDIIPYTNNEALFIVEALRPATVSYICLTDKIDEKNGHKIVVAIVKDGQLSLAIGRKGANTRVAGTLTGWSIQIHEEEELDNLKSEYEFKSVEELKEEDKQRAKKEAYDNYLAQVKLAKIKEEAQKELTSGVEKNKPQQILDEDIKEEKAVKEEVKPVVNEEVSETSSKDEEVKVTTPTTVKVTTTLESLEASLENEKKKETPFKATHKTSKRPHNITEQEVAHEESPVEVSTKKSAQMDIYTKEELEDLENESYDDDNYDDEDIDYDEYDKYYDDDDK